MADHRAWLVSNERSGSTTSEAVETLEEACSRHGLAIERSGVFPDDALPDAAALAGFDVLVVHGGDGTTNAAIRAAYGWNGAVLTLPGGTMNLIALRLHGEADAHTIVQRFCRGAIRRVRPQIARCGEGDALGGLLAGPGTAWHTVREAMREASLIEAVTGSAEAMAETLGDSTVRCARPQLGKAEGYPLIELTPGAHGLQADGFHAETAGDFAAQGWALVRRRFREGPHDRVALSGELVLKSTDGAPVSLLIDGEPASAGPSVTLTSVPTEVDLIASENGF